MSKETFKTFVRQNPSFTNYVNNGTMTWQKFYDMYELYGENNEVWSKYKNNETTETRSSSSTSSLLGDTSLKDLFNAIKKVDLESVRKGVDGLQKAVSLVQDLSGNKNNKEQYRPRPMYKYFED